MSRRRQGSDAVTIARATDALTLHPLLYTDLSSGEINNCLYDHLVMTDALGRFVPGRLVESWQVWEDGLVWTFHLKRTAHWHDGHDVTASDAQFTFELILDPAVGSPRRAEFVVNGRPLRFAALDRHTLEVRLPEPFAPFLDAIAWRPVLPRHVHAGVPLEPPAPGGRWPVGSGPFRLAEWVASDRLVLEAVPDYAPQPASLDRVVWRYVPDRAPDLFARGALDYLPGVRPDDRDRLASIPGAWLRRITDGNCTALIFRLDHPPFDDVRVRRALGQAADRQALVAEVLRGDGEPAASLVAPDRPWHNPRLRAPASDPDAARRLLAEAGWRPGDDGILVRDGRRFRFTVVAPAPEPTKMEAAHRLAAQFARIGVRMDVRGVGYGEFVRDHLRPRAFDAVMLTQVPNFDIEDLYAFYHSSQGGSDGWNYSGYRRAEVDRLLDLGRSTYGFEQRKPFYDRAQELVAADAPDLCLFHSYTTDAAAGRVSIPDAPRAHGGRYLRLHEWRVAGPAPRSGGDPSAGPPLRSIA